MSGSAAFPLGVDEVGHTHADVSGGWLRPSVFGAMDGLVTNIALVAGVDAAGASLHFVVLTGMAGLVAGAFSMALGEYTSVRTQNEQIDREWSIEAREIEQGAVQFAASVGAQDCTEAIPCLPGQVTDPTAYGNPDSETVTTTATGTTEVHACALTWNRFGQVPSPPARS